MRLISVLFLSFVFAHLGMADTISLAVNGPFPFVSNLLDNEGISASGETTVESFFVPGSGDADLTFELTFRSCAFQRTFGFFDFSSITADPIADKQTWATQALTGATVVFDDRIDPEGATSTHTVSSGSELGFFILPNNVLQDFLDDPAEFYPPNFGRSPLFSASNANPGEFDQMLSFIGGGKTLFTFEDLTRTGGSDQNFVDLAFSLDVELASVRPGDPPAMPDPEPNPMPEPDPVVPEPSGLSLAMLGGLMGLLSRRRRR